MNTTYLTIAVICLILSLGLFIYYLLNPKNEKVEFYMSNDSNVNPKVKTALNLFGGDVLALMPNRTKKSIHSLKIDNLFRESANPWQVTQLEFFLIRLLYSISAFALSLIFVVIFRTDLGLLLSIGIVLAATYMGYRQPYVVYKAEAKRRTKQFQAQLPEAIDYLAMTMSAGSSSLPEAFRKVVGYLPEGVVREEFELVVKNLAAGQTMEYALNQLAERAPNEGINAFVKAMNNAHRVSIPMTELLRQRSVTSRKDAEAELDKKIKSMPYYIMFILAPTVLISLMIIVLAPNMSLLTFGG